MENRPIDPSLRPDAARPARDAAAARPTASEPTGPAFQALLERLERRARELADASGEVRRPDELADAVGRAKDSLEDALAVERELLEAWRASRVDGAAGGGEAAGAGEVGP